MPSSPSAPPVTVTIMLDSPSNFFYRPPPVDEVPYAEVAPTESVHISGRICIHCNEPRLAKQLLVKYSTSYHLAFPGECRPRVNGANHRRFAESVLTFQANRTSEVC